MKKTFFVCFFIFVIAGFSLWIPDSRAADLELLPCATDADCGSLLEFCSKAPGDCDGKGVCTTRPDICTDEYDPVCGCDGNTYGNPCEAAAAGVNIAHKGECKIGSECFSNDECAPADYCAKVPGNCDGRGICSERPIRCPLFYDPVCGCDGNTYGNECEAAAAGVNVAHQGECKIVRDCFTNDECSVTEFCSKVPGDCDGLGACTERPDLCPLFFDPVCGCDGNTYGNECEAAAAGVNIASKGACECIPTADREKGKACSDGVDNDCDGLIDWNDPDCKKGKKK